MLGVLRVLRVLRFLHVPFRRSARPLAASLAAGIALALAGCGGGVSVGYVDDGTGPPPSIALTAATDAAYAGDRVELDASVRASNGVDTVTFYRSDGDGPTRLGTLGSSPWSWVVDMPPVGGVTVFYFAEVCDFAGYCRDSNDVAIDVID